MVMPDSAPYLLSSKSLDLGTVFVDVAFEFLLSGSDFADKEDDTPIFSCDILTTASNANWIAETPNTATNTIKFAGIPPTNNYAGSYVFVCAVTDQYLPDINFYQFRLTVIQN